MASSVQPIPAPYHTVTPYLVVKSAAQAIEFYKQAFGAVEHLCLGHPGGEKIAHAEIRIGDSMIMLADEVPEMGFLGPESPGKSPVSILLYVEDVDNVFQRAIAAGGTELRPSQDQFYGDRSGTLTDPFGHTWTIATHVEDVSQEEVGRRFAAMMQQQHQQ